MEEKQFADLKISPSELQNLEFHRKRAYGTGKLVEYIKFDTPTKGTVFLFDTVSKNQFVSRIGGKISEIRHIWNWQDRNSAINHLANRREEPVILRLVRSDGGDWHCYAVVTDKFTEVKHVEVFSMVERELTGRDMQWIDIKEMRTSRRLWRTYLFEKQVGKNVGDLIQVGLRVCNSVKGTSSVIFYPFWKRLACSNGMTSSEGVWKPATTHVGEKLDILESIKSTLKEALDQAFGIEKYIERAMEIKLEENQIQLLIKEIAYRKSFSDYAYRYIKYRMQRGEEKNTLWGVINAITWVSSHDVKATMTQIKMEQVAHSLLKGGEEAIREFTAPAPSISPEVETHG